MICRNRHNKRIAKRSKRSLQASAERPIVRQKKVLFSLAGVGASGFADISVPHDIYMYDLR